MTPQDKIQEMQMRIAALIKKELMHQEVSPQEVAEKAGIRPLLMRVLLGEVLSDDYPLGALTQLGQYLGMTFTINLGESRPRVAVVFKSPMTFQVRLIGMAMMEQNRSVEAATEEEALARAKSDYGSYTWSYEGMDDDTVTAEIQP